MRKRGTEREDLAWRQAGGGAVGKLESLVMGNKRALGMVMGQMLEHCMNATQS